MVSTTIQTKAKSVWCEQNLIILSWTALDFGLGVSFEPNLHHRRCITMCSFLREIACHHACASGQTLTEQTSSPSGEMNGSRLRWLLSVQWMTSLSCNQDSTYLDATGHSWIESGPTKATALPVERSGALQQPTCALVANAKRCHILSTAAHSPSWRGLQRLHSADDVATEWLKGRRTACKCTRQQHPSTRWMVNGVNWVRNDSRLLPTENWKTEHVQNIEGSYVGSRHQFT